MPSEPPPIVLTHRDYDPDFYRARESPARTFCLLKPDAVARRLVGTILNCLETRGFRLFYLQTVRASAADIIALYPHVAPQPHWPELLAFMTSGSMVAAVLGGVPSIPDPVGALRRQVGPFGSPFVPGTIRRLYMRSDDPPYHNLVHAADSPAAAAREAAIFLREGLQS
jgi:nucleoside-diphosphate kinase